MNFYNWRQQHHCNSYISSFNLQELHITKLNFYIEFDINFTSCHWSSNFMIEFIKKKKLSIFYVSTSIHLLPNCLAIISQPMKKKYQNICLISYSYLIISHLCTKRIFNYYMSATTLHHMSSKDLDIVLSSHSRCTGRWKMIEDYPSHFPTTDCLQSSSKSTA